MFAASKTASSGSAPDAQFNYVTMLLHGDGTNGAQNNTFLDSSTNNFTITRNGNTTQGSFSPYGSNWSNYFDGTIDYLTISTGTALNLNTGDFTIEGWIYPISTSNYFTLFSNGDYPSTSQIIFLVDGTNTLNLYMSNGSGWSVSLASSISINLNTWTHIAATASGTTYTVWVNGVSGGSSTVSFTRTSPNATSLIGRLYPSTNNYYAKGYISNVRVVKGTALYTTTFTPSTTPLTAVSGTSLLTCQSNRFIDNSTNALTIISGGAPSVQRFNPFGASTAYSTSVIGGSGYFDGAGDYLNVGNPSVNSQLALGSNDFTIQAWVYPRGTGIYTILGSLNNSNGNGSYWLMVNGTFSGGGQIQFGYNYVSGGSGGNDALFGTGTLPVNAWSFVAVTRSGSNLRGYVNGVQVGTTNTTIGSRTIYPTNQALYVGRNIDSDAYAMNGYLSDVQLVNGTALYTGSTMTVPTAPSSPVTNTALLCNMTNGAIYDNAMMNDLETVGNAQISTSVVKFGTGSLYFDGTGDSLSVLNTPTSTVWGTESWTIEGWIYPTAVSASYRTIYANGYPVQIYQLNGSIEIYISSTNSFSYIVNGLTGPASSVTANTWVHFAVVKNGSAYRVYVNGVGGSTVTDATAIAYTSTTNAIIGDAPFGSYPFVGYIDDFRITKGYARYTANFTPPTAAFSNTGPI